MKKNTDQYIADAVATQILGGDASTDEAIKDASGRVVKETLWFDASLFLTFTDDSVLHVEHGTASCCESRYLTCDDDHASFIGSKFLNAITKEATSTEDGQVHEISFYELVFNDGTITLASHNEHNGYYSGTDVNTTFKPA